MGDAVAFGMQFRGARVLQAVLADLVQLGLGSESGRPLVILGGQSAGGRGAMVSLEYVRDMLGPELAQRVDVMGFLDSPLWVDVPPYSAHFVGFAAMCQGVFSYANVTRLGRRCEAAHPGSDRWKCIMGEYRMPHIRTPYLLVASQYDAFQLSENSISLPKDANETAYADSLANRTRDLMSTLRAGWQPGGLQNAHPILLDLPRPRLQLLVAGLRPANVRARPGHPRRCHAAVPRSGAPDGLPQDSRHWSGSTAARASTAATGAESASSGINDCGLDLLRAGQDRPCSRTPQGPEHPARG
ncbi:unnamed protein product [Prorocentrum cordatum]|uniref:Pectin acetylesterase n=1 Tax=Prorocentrum cordatum TaxID=2364126 RepID=A0ABN9X1X6_9DINO|nr:unnamed protein product [Polarella glacialis]